MRRIIHRLICANPPRPFDPCSLSRSSRVVPARPNRAGVRPWIIAAYRFTTNTTAELDVKLSTLEGRKMNARQSRKRKNRRWVSGILIGASFVALGSRATITHRHVAAGGANQESDWPAYGRDPGGA